MINLTAREYEKYRRKGIRTNEGYIFPNPKNKSQIIKAIEPQPRVPEYLEIKEYTIKLLLNNADYLRDLNIANPEEDVRIDMIPRAYSAARIKGMDLADELSHPNTSLESKIDYLKQVGKILSDMEEIRKKHPHLSNFFYNDIHERNFLVTSDNIVYGIDLDSCSIADNIPIQGMYPLFMSKIKKLYEKYPRCDKVCEFSTSIVPSKNLDLYCYIIMILNFMYGAQSYNRWNPTTLNNYLNYLESHGGNLEFLYALSCIYDTDRDNINPDYLLDYIKEIYQHSNIRFDESGTLRRILR